MSRGAPWRRASADPAVGPASEPALAYAADDGSLTLYNDYGQGTAWLRAAPAPSGFAEPAALWGGPDRADGNRPLAPPEPVEGYGVFTFPYGPISMGVPESGRFDVRTYGERVLGLVPVGGFKTRGIRDALVGLTVADALLRVERWAGHLSASHASAFLGACESAAGRPVPTTDLWARAFAQELQRIYNHVHVVARIAEAASQNVGLAQAHALAEQLLRLQGELFGHRWLFGAFTPGAGARRLDRSTRARCPEALGRLAREFEDLWLLFLGSRTFVDRIQGTCPVGRAEAVRWGAVGPALRAAGVPWDDRLRQPVPPYTDLFLELPRETEGDALARVVVRAEEVRASFLLLEQMLERWPSDATATEAPWPEVEPGRGLGRVEGPSGDLVYDVRLADGRVERVGVRTPTRANFPLFALGLRGGVFTDFHFAFESFGLSFAETDG